MIWDRVFLTSFLWSRRKKLREQVRAYSHLNCSGLRLWCILKLGVGSGSILAYFRAALSQLEDMVSLGFCYLLCAKGMETLLTIELIILSFVLYVFVEGCSWICTSSFASIDFLVDNTSLRWANKRVFILHLIWSASSQSEPTLIQGWMQLSFVH